MWRKQQEEDDEGQIRHDFDDSSVEYFEASKVTKTPFDQYEDHDQSFSWEEQAFAEDAAAAGRLGGCVWPPRSYSCSFCRREFRSAQALGGHMNVHRRDRARLKQTPNDHLCSTLAYDHDLLPNPKPYLPDPLPNGVISCGGRRSESKTEKLDEKLGISCPRVREKDDIGIEILDQAGLNFGFGRPRSSSGLFDNGQEEAFESCKRRKMDGETSIQFYVKSSSLIERQNHHRHHQHHIQSEVIGLSSSSLHDLDLELRLGGFSKG